MIFSTFFNHVSYRRYKVREYSSVGVCYVSYMVYIDLQILQCSKLFHATHSNRSIYRVLLRSTSFNSYSLRPASNAQYG